MTVETESGKGPVMLYVIVRRGVDVKSTWSTYTWLHSSFYSFLEGIMRGHESEGERE